MIFKHLASTVIIMIKCDVEFISNRRLIAIHGTFNVLYSSPAFQLYLVSVTYTSISGFWQEQSAFQWGHVSCL